MQQCAQTAAACMRLVHAARMCARASHAHRVGGYPRRSELRFMFSSNLHAALCMSACPAALKAVCRHAQLHSRMCMLNASLLCATGRQAMALAQPSMVSILAGIKAAT